MAGRDLAEERHLLLHVNPLDGPHREMVVPKQAVHAQQLHQREVAQKARRLARERAVCAGGFVHQVVLDLGRPDEAVEVGEHRGGLPDVGVLPEEGDVVLLLRLDCLPPHHAEGLVVVHELVRHVPEPLRRQQHGQLAGLQVADDEVQQLAVVLPGAPAVLQADGEPRVDVPVVELLVKYQEQGLAGDLLLHRVGVRPLLVRVVLVCQLVKSVLVELVELGDGALLQRLEQLAEEVVHGAGDRVPAHGLEGHLAGVAVALLLVGELARRLLAVGRHRRRAASARQCT
mmetsp:Transcript_62257/g.173946  ORF Transcript_62257/g.173946 Transcript_62257/m.173946 type:complete len:287 (+) Transcript_62257:808-1668(+)